jgi:lysophospholipase L1-like esterase
MRCNTTKLAVQTAPTSGGRKKFDVYIDGQLCKHSAAETSSDENTLILFEGLDDHEKEIIIYLPHVQEVEITAIGVDPNTKFGAPEHRFARSLPVVFYGSSVCQGSGALNPAQTYEAILCRDLNLDFVNLGFGGAGKAEANVVALVNAAPACCYVFDLGKSYGTQDASAFKALLITIRHGHPNVPIVVITPITSAKEDKEPSYSERSTHTRTVMRDSAKALIEAGDKQLYLVEGESLIGFNEHDVLSHDGVHPSNQGYGVIAKKLAPVLRKALSL